MLAFLHRVRQQLPAEEIDRYRYGRGEPLWGEPPELRRHETCMSNDSTSWTESADCEQSGVLTEFFFPNEALREALLCRNTQYGTWLLQKYGVQCLIPCGWFPILHAAVKCGNLDIAASIIRTSKLPEHIASYRNTYIPGETRSNCGTCQQKLYINQPGCSAIQKGNTPLHEACQIRNYPMIELLLTEGACASCLNEDGDSPVDLICHLYHSDEYPADSEVLLQSLVLLCRYQQPEELRWLEQYWKGQSTTIENIAKAALSRSMTLVSLSRWNVMQAIGANRLPEGLSLLIVPESLTRGSM